MIANQHIVLICGTRFVNSGSVVRLHALDHYLTFGTSAQTVKALFQRVFLSLKLGI